MINDMFKSTGLLGTGRSGATTPVKSSPNDTRYPVPALAAGALSAGTAAITIPAGTAPGTYYLFAVADGDGAVAETSETNNARLAVIQVTGP